MDLAPGSTFAGYRVRRRLGQGGMGQVYLVANPALDRDEALKVISSAASTAPDFAERFAREARTAARLDHPAIITVHAYGVEGDAPWFTMRHLDGHDLTEVRLPDAEIAEVGRQVAGALDYAHRRGVIHRDIKPANIIVTRDDEDCLESVTVLDFGIAKLVDTTGLTGTNMFIGTLSYSAPELIDGQPPTPAADQYSLACTVYQLLTGRPPFVATSPLALMRAHADKAPPPIGAHRPDLAALDPVFARALAKGPADRFPACRDFAAAVSAVLDAPQRPAATPAPQGARPETRGATPPPPPIVFPPSTPVRPRSSSSTGPQPSAENSVPGRTRSAEKSGGARAHDSAYHERTVRRPEPPGSAPRPPGRLPPPADRSGPSRAPQPINGRRVNKVAVWGAVVGAVAVVGAGIAVAWGMNSGTDGSGGRDDERAPVVASAPRTPAVSTVPSAGPATAGPDVRVCVLNAGAVSGLTKRYGDQLTAAGYTVTETGNLVTSSVNGNTVIYDADQAAAAQELAERVGAATMLRPQVFTRCPGALALVVVS